MATKRVVVIAGDDAAPEAVRLTAVERVYAAGSTLTPDQGGKAHTQAFCDAVAQYL